MKRFFLGSVTVVCSAIALFSCLWMAMPLVEPDKEEPGETTVYYLRDDGGRVAVFADADDSRPLAVYDIYVNLLPESDILRLKTGISVSDESALEQLLEDLGA